MIITLSRSGGFTGIPLKKTIDTSTLPKAKAKKIEDLLGQANFNNTKQSAKIIPKPDQFCYTISLGDTERLSSIKIPEQELTGSIKVLVENLLETKN